MSSPRVAMPAHRIDRRERAASELAVGDFVNDPLVPFVVARFETSPGHVVALVGMLASGTEMGARYRADAPLDVSRIIRTAPAPAVIRRRHLSLCPPLGGA